MRQNAEVGKAGSPWLAMSCSCDHARGTARTPPTQNAEMVELSRNQVSSLRGAVVPDSAKEKQTLLFLKVVT